jgi:cysteinyl-tRNA synthetase
MHNEMLQVEGKKMSKSLGNFFTVRDLLDQGIPGEVIRFVFLQTHYSKPMDWTAEKARQAEATLRKWRQQTAGVTPADRPLDQVTALLADDLNTAGAIAEIHQLSHASDAPNLLASARLLGLLTDDFAGWADASRISGATLSVLDDLSGRMARMREKAMETKDFAPLDRLKADLAQAGVEVRMSKTGIELVPGPDIDPAALEALL